MADSGALIALSSSASGLIISAFQHFLPTLREVRQADQKGTTRVDLWAGEVAAGVLTIAIGGMYSYLTGSAVPLLMTILLALLIIGLYEWAIRLPSGGSNATKPA